MESRKIYTVRACQHILELGRRTHVMGIVNMSPDSFSRDGRNSNDGDLQAHVAYAHSLIEQGADSLDIGGQSTRPGADMVEDDEEIARVVPLIKALSDSHVPLSVDSFKPRVIEAALAAGASIVNNIMGTPLNPDVTQLVKDSRAAMVIMHIRGNPKTMQNGVEYKDVVKEVCESLRISLEQCLAVGVDSAQLIVDPGIGFGKTVEHNLLLLKHLKSLVSLEYPVLVGVSRKSFIGHVLKREVDDRLLGSLSAADAAVVQGAHMVRAHDVNQTRQSVDMLDAILNAS